MSCLSAPSGAGAGGRRRGARWWYKLLLTARCIGQVRGSRRSVTAYCIKVQNLAVTAIGIENLGDGNRCVVASAIYALPVISKISFGGVEKATQVLLLLTLLVVHVFLALMYFIRISARATRH